METSASNQPPNENVTIVPASLEDLNSVNELLEPFVQERLLLRRTPEELSSLLPTGFLAVPETPAGVRPPVGFCSVEIYSKKLAEIQCLCVHRDYRRHGIGRRLVEACVGLAKQRGVMEVMAISSSEQFLREIGFDYSLPEQKRALFYQLRSRYPDS